MARQSTMGRQPPGVQQVQGAPQTAGPRPGKRIVVGDEVYLWILVAIELIAIFWARSAFSRYHGG